MAVTSSHMLQLGTPAPDFSLPDPDGKIHTLADFGDHDVLVVAFICNHCPFVQHIRGGLAIFAQDFTRHNVALVAINANDADTHPTDAPARMREEAEAAGYQFPYLFDETQEVAKAFRAVCTPEFYLFDGERKLAYRGQFDGARPGNPVPVTGADLRRATDALLTGETPNPEQHASTGCSIKWRPGNAPDYIG